MSSPHLEVMRKAAKYYGLSFKKFDTGNRFQYISDGKRKFMINRSATEFTSRIGYMLAHNKQRTNQVLEHFGFSVPKQKVFEEFNEVLPFFKKYAPIVLKPLNNSLGNGVTVNINSISKLKKAFKFAKEFSKQVLAEQFIEGDDYRVTVINYKHVYAVQRIPAYVRGDGHHTISKLIDIKNQKRKLYKHDILKDERSKQILSEQGYKMSDIPGKDERVFLRRAANIAEGGTSIDVTDQLSDSIANMCIEASKILKLPTSGLDILTEDLGGNKATIIEANYRAHIVLHHYPHKGKRRYPARQLMKMMFPSIKK